VSFFRIISPTPQEGGAERAKKGHTLSRTRFRRYRGRRVLLSCFKLPNSFSTVPSASGPVFMFCALGLIFGGAESVRPRFHVLRSRTHFRRGRVRKFPLSYFALTDSFSAERRVSGPVFIFCALGHVFDCTEGVRSRFHVLRPRTRCQRYRERQFPLSYFAQPDSDRILPPLSALSIKIYIKWGGSIIIVIDVYGVYLFSYV
jgi:hypothetical protein